MDSQLVLDTGGDDVIAFTEAAVSVNEELRNQEERYALRAGGSGKTSR